MPGHGHFRAHVRKPLQLQAGLQLDGSGAEQPGRITNLGLGGACVECQRGTVTEAIVMLRVMAPTLWDPLVLRATVAWARKLGSAHRMGLRFSPMDEASVAALVDLLNAQDYDLDT